MESSSARGNASEGIRLGYARSASMDSTVRPSFAVRSSSQLSRRSSSQGSRGSISLSREMGDSILSSMRHSLQSADQLLGDEDSSVLAQLIDSGDRDLAPEGDVDEDTANISDRHKVGPLPEDAMMNNNGKVAAAPVCSMDSKDTVAYVPASSSAKVEPYKPSLRIDYASYLIHLAVFGFFGVFTRYGLQKLFGPGCLAPTSDQSPLYPDLPSNMLGSFLMGWFGIIFKADLRQISDHLVIGITTGYMGSLTTFSGWNQKMVVLSSKGHWV